MLNPTMHHVRLQTGLFVGVPHTAGSQLPHTLHHALLQMALCADGPHMASSQLQC